MSRPCPHPTSLAGYWPSCWWFWRRLLERNEQWSKLKLVMFVVPRGWKHYPVVGLVFEMWKPCQLKMTIETNWVVSKVTHGYVCLLNIRDDILLTALDRHLASWDDFHPAFQKSPEPEPKSGLNPFISSRVIWLFHVTQVKVLNLCGPWWCSAIKPPAESTGRTAAPKKTPMGFSRWLGSTAGWLGSLKGGTTPPSGQRWNREFGFGVLVFFFFLWSMSQDSTKRYPKTLGWFAIQWS